MVRTRRPLGPRERLRLAWAGRFGPLPRPDRWVFIVGCYNSGTTMLHALLASHPDVGSMPFEGQFYTDQLRLPLAEGLPRLWAEAPDLFRLTETSGGGIDVVRLKRQWGARYDAPRRPVLIEKTPTNAGRTLWLQRHFADAHFVGVVRDGYAVAEGIRRKAGHPIARAAAQWAASNEIMLADFERLDRRIVVRYEELTERPRLELARLTAFLGLRPFPFDPTERTWSIFERRSHIRNMNARSYAALSDRDRADVERRAGHMLAALGYARPPSSVS